MAESRRDVIVVGASAGGVEALRSVVASLPADVPAAVLVAMHLRAGGTSALSTILDRVGPLPAVQARDGMELRHGHIYVAVPDRHLLVDDGALTLAKGPTESGHRPAINALFRSAALWAGPRTIGVVLSGVLDDGALGMRAIAGRGGATVVQDPADALHAGMPENTLRLVDANHVVPADGMGELLGKLAGQVVDPTAVAPAPPAMLLEDKIARDGLALAQRRSEGEVTMSGLTCPDCNGSLFDVEPGSGAYRCRIGHAWSDAALLSAQGDEFQRALWIALRSLDEKSALSRKMQRDAVGRRQTGLSERFGRAVRECATAAEVLREFLISLDDSSMNPADTENATG